MDTPTTSETERQGAVTRSALLGVGECGLHRRTPYGMTNVSTTQLSIARHYGGIKYNDESYTYLPKTDELIRDDVLKWKRKQERAAKTPAAAISDTREKPSTKEKNARA